MRGVFGLMAVLMLVALSQPAWATCVYRAMAKTCTFEKRGFWKDDLSPAVEADTKASDSTTPSAEVPRDNAWVVTPATTDGAVVLHTSSSEATATEAACGSDSDC